MQHEKPPTPESASMLVTSEMMRDGVVPLLFTGGACNVQDIAGPMRNAGRDPLARWLDGQGWSYFDPQIHPATHGRGYLWELDGPFEKQARLRAKLRVYEIIPTTISSVSMLEIMDDARLGRASVVWWHGRKNFAPIGLGGRAALRADQELRERVGEVAYSHLMAYVKAGRQLRQEIQVLLEDCPHVLFVEGFRELQETIRRLLQG